MNHTPYSTANQTFSNLAHAAAEDQIYPFLFNCHRSDLEFQDTGLRSGGDGAILDGKMGVDWCVSVKSSRFVLPFEHSVQERFRKPEYMHNHDLTITEFNEASKQPSELYKIKSGIFVYGYFDAASCVIHEWVAADTTKMLFAMQSNRIDFCNNFNHRSRQRFVSVRFNDLFRAGVLLAYKKEGGEPVVL